MKSKYRIEVDYPSDCNCWQDCDCSSDRIYFYLLDEKHNQLCRAISDYCGADTMWQKIPTKFLLLYKEAFDSQAEEVEKYGWYDIAIQWLLEEIDKRGDK